MDHSHLNIVVIVGAAGVVVSVLLRLLVVGSKLPGLIMR
jgi:hypothetical protein